MNLALQIEQYLPQQLLKLIKIIAEEADNLGRKVYLVGGIVRDILLDYPNFDLDFVVEGDAVELAQQIAGISQAKLVTHPRFGTAKLDYGNFTLDMATTRGETYAKFGALPTVTPSSLNDDLFRRDFSINAMAVSLARNDYGELIDPYGGKNDLEHRLIRILHSRSFSDDATRILRAIRYEQRLGFKLESQTAWLLKRDIPMLDTISGDRIRHELELILRERYPEYPIKRLGELGILQRINPALKGDAESCQLLAISFQKARQLNKPRQLPSLYFCLFIYSLNEGENEEFLQRLNIPKKLSCALRDTLRLKNQLSLLDRPSMKHSEIYYFLHEYDSLAIQANAIAAESSTIHHHLQLFLTKLRYVKTFLNGEELKRLGIPTGPGMGKILQTLHKAKLDGEVNTKAEEENFAFGKIKEINPEP